MPCHLFFDKMACHLSFAEMAMKELLLHEPLMTAQQMTEICHPVCASTPAA